MFITITILSVYLGIIIIVFFSQTKLIFPIREKLMNNYDFEKSFNLEEVFLLTPDGKRINGLFFPNCNKRVILFFHGNSGSLKGWQYAYKEYGFTNYNFFIIDYRGYGKSSGKITEDGLYIDAQTAYNYIIEKGFEKKNIIVYGYSIGTGVAVELAKNNIINSLILEAPFTNLKKLVNQKFPYLLPSAYLKYKFNNIDKINKMNAPLLIIHGTNDDNIPFNQGEAIYNSFKGVKHFIKIEGGGHDNLNRFREFNDGILFFLTKVIK